MDFEEYQKLAMRTASPGSHEKDLLVAALGLAGESGEVIELIKKHAGHGHALDVAKLAKELGDVLWYVARISEWAGVQMGDVAQANIDKLRARYPEGFSSERSINRVSGNGG